MATATQEVQGIEATFQLLDLGNITPSPLNPRKRFDEKGLKELSESIRSHGVQQPILVRPIRPRRAKGDLYEIVVGERRYKASKLAQRTHIPAIIRDLSNADALEIMVIENLQREDVHPLDEALGYEALMKHKQETDPELGELPGAPAHTAESIAAKVGKSVGYVYARLKLLSLIAISREAFEKDLITPGHAVLIARLQPMDQVRALDACFHRWGGIGDREIRKLDPAKVKLEDLRIDPIESGLLPEKALREWIQENINLRLKDVPWSLDDAELLPEAGACANCLKRSTSNPGLFGELAIKGEDTCFDAACFKLKRDAFVKRTIQENKHEVKVQNAPQKGPDGPEPEKQGPIAKPLLQLSDLGAYTKAKPDQATYRRGQWLPAKAGSCADVRKGIMIRGEDAGQERMVCVNDKCKVHKHTLHNTPSGGSGREDDYEEESFKRHREAIRYQKRGRARGILLQEIIKNVDGKIPEEFLRYTITRLIGDSELVLRRDAPILSWLMGEKKPLDPKQVTSAIEKADEKKLRKWLVASALMELLEGGDKKDDEDWRGKLIDIGKAFGLKTAGAILKGADEHIAEAKACRACGCTEEVPCTFYDNNKHVQCSWKEDDLCSNPKCVTHEAKKAKAK